MRAWAVAAMTFAALACTRSLDTKKAQEVIKTGAAAKGVTLTDVSCPASVKAEKGAGFTCNSKSADGDAITWDCTQKDDDGDFDFRSTQVMDQQKLGDLVEPQLSSKVGGAIDMKCPDKWIVAKPGAKFSCDATVGGTAKKVDCVFGEGTHYDCQLH